MFKIECEGCQHDDGNAEHCFFWGLPVSTITDRECQIAKVRQGSCQNNDRGVIMIPKGAGKR